MHERVAWITGGSRGIGYATAEALASQGYTVVISARDTEALSRAASTLEAGGLTAIAIPCDVADEASIQTAYDAILAKAGSSPDILVNNAGVSPWETFSETVLEDFDAALATNVRGMFLCSQHVLPGMYERRSGAIIQILSVASTKGYKNGAAYVASKFAALGFTNALREEARKHGVRVISVMPGAVETDLWGASERAQFHDKMMQPADIAQIILAALDQPDRALVEEILIRPMVGDL